MTNLATAFDALPSTPRMPALFIGHGNPMNAIEDNAYSRSWAKIGADLPVPSAILCVSAHWMTRGTTLVNLSAHPETIHDFGGFPKKLFEQQYPAPGAPEFAQATAELLASHHATTSEEWGLDHGAWSVLIKMFPKADIPVYQLSLDLSMPPEKHLALARDLKALREKGVLIIGSGNVVHNLMALAPGGKPYDWAEAFDSHIADLFEARDFDALTRISALGPLARAAHPTLEHYLPLIYTAGVADQQDTLQSFNASFDLGSISMRSFLFA
jgi:4,5-DOPA dioxygenase extradiol